MFCCSVSGLDDAVWFLVIWQCTQQCSRTSSHVTMYLACLQVVSLWCRAWQTEAACGCRDSGQGGQSHGRWSRHSTGVVKSLCCQNWNKCRSVEWSRDALACFQGRCSAGESCCCVARHVVGLDVSVVGWLCGTAVEHQSLTNELSLSCAQPTVDGWPLVWVNRPL